jgi:hypothetical protein
MGQKRECKLEVYFKVGLINPSADWSGGVVSTSLTRIEEKILGNAVSGRCGAEPRIWG